MEFCPELAVLHGTFALIKSQDNDLEKCTYPECMPAIQPLIQTIEDITEGLEYPHSGPEKYAWSWKLCALLLARTLSKYDEDDKDKTLMNNDQVLSDGPDGYGIGDGVEKIDEEMEESDWDDVLEECLPRLSIGVYFGLVKACCWENVLCEILTDLKEEVQISLMNVFLAHLTQCQDKRDAAMFHAICKYSVKQNALLVSKCAVSPESTKKKVAPSSVSMEKPKEVGDTKDLYDQSDYSIPPNKLLMFSNLYETCHGEIEHFYSQESKRDILLCLMADATYMAQVLCITKSGKLEILSAESVHNMNGPIKSLLVKVLNLIYLCINTEKQWQAGFYSLDLDPESDDVNIDCGFVTLEKFTASLNQVLDMEGLSDIENPAKTVLKTLEPVFTELSEKYREELKRREPTLVEKLDNARLYIIERKTGWKEWLLWLLNPKETMSGLEKSRWLDCLEDNVDALAEVEYIHKILDLLSNIQVSHDNHVTSRLKKLALSVYKELDIVAQNDIFPVLLENCNWEKDDIFHQTLTSVFNRLTTTGKRGKQVQCELLGLALQSPHAVMEKIVQYAVVNNGQVQLVNQLLKSAPALCQCRVQDQTILPLLEDVLFSWLGKQDLEETHRQNLVALLVAVIQDEPPLIASRNLIQYFVVPQFSLLETNPTFMLQVFQKVLQCSPSCLCDNECCDLLVIVVCLCNIIDMCSCSLWEPWDTGNRVVLKQCCLEILQDMTIILHDQQFLESDVEWLCQQLCNISWQARLYADPVLKSIDSQLFLKVYPKSVSSICHLPSAEWIESNEEPEEAEVSLLKLCAVSSGVTAAVISALNCNATLSYQSLLAATVQVLPNCLLSEWKNVLQLVGHLVKTDQVIVNYRSHYIKHLPFVNLTDVKLELSLLQITADVMCLFQTLYGVNGGDAFWLHLNQCGANTLKTIVSNLSLPAESEAFLLSQAVCQCCHLLSILQTSGTESLFVLVLDWLTMLQSEKFLKYGKMYRDTMQQSITFIYNEQWIETLMKLMSEI